MTELTGELWQGLVDVVGEALEHPSAERAAFLERSCNGNEVLHREARSLLAFAGDGVDLLGPIRLTIPLPAGPVAPGDRVGGFEVLELLGEGGSGAVFRARELDAGREVALKILRPEAASLAEDEIPLLARLTHPDVARLYDSGVHEGLPYLVMELVDGLALDRFCDGRRLAIAERVRIVARVARAVDAVHRRQVVHRDLKPANVLVDGDGNPKLLDFGIARHADAAGAAEVTETADRRLTLAFASPEQVGGDPVGAASDVYSLGVLLYLLLSGRLPYAVESPHALAQAILEQEALPPSRAIESDEPFALGDGTVGAPSLEPLAAQRRSTPRELGRQLRRDLDAIAVFALRKEPAERYPSAGALATDLERWLARRPVAARPASTAYRLRKGIERHPVTATLGIALGALGVISVLGWWRSRQRARRDRDWANAARAEDRRLLEVLAGALVANLPAGRMGSVRADVRSRLGAARTAADRLDAILEGAAAPGATGAGARDWPDGGRER